MLRRTIVLCMAVCLIMTGCLHAAAAAEGSADQLSSRLDAAFASGRATLREIPLAGLTIRPEDVVVPPGFESEAQGDQLRQWIDTLYVVSLSPDGTTAMLTDGDQLLAWRQGKLRVILQSAARGVEDVNGNLTSLWKSPYKRYFGGYATEVAWSPDGRYAVITNGRTVLINARMEYNPHLIDMETGEVFLVAAYGKNMFKDKTGAAVSACFSRDGRYVYYMLYGNAHGARTALVRYDLQTGQLEPCLSASDFDYYGNLCELKDGSFLIIQDVKTPKREQQRLARYLLTGSGWVRFPHKTLAPAASAAYVNRMVYAPDSGYALVSYVSRAPYFRRFRPDQGYNGLNEYWAFDARSGGVVPLTWEQMTEIGNSVMSGKIQPSLNYEYIMAMALSPDGEYALFETALNGGWHLRLVRLSDMSALEVGGIDPERLVTLPADRARIEWNGDVLLTLMRDRMCSLVIE